MLNFKSALALLLFSSTVVFAQKGIDTQTKTIKDDGNRVTTRTNDVTRSIDWGKGKTRVRERLSNPYKFTSRRDKLVESILEVLKDNKFVIDESASRPAEGFIITQPLVFAKGAVISQSELGRYGVLQSSDTPWTRGQYSLTIEVQPIDGLQNNVIVNAKIEGRAGNGLGFEWVTIQSSGLAEDQILSKIVEAVTGVSPDPVQDQVDN